MRWSTQLLRQGFLPDALKSNELGGAWNTGLGLAVLTAWVVDAAEYPSLEGESWRLLATSEEVCEVRAGVELTDLHPDEMPLLVSADGEFWAATAPSSPGVLWEDIEDVLSE